MVGMFLVASGFGVVVQIMTRGIDNIKWKKKSAFSARNYVKALPGSYIRKMVYH
jgi:hypothetical protein